MKHQQLFDDFLTGLLLPALATIVLAAGIYLS
jgi:hypothetical protein